MRTLPSDPEIYAVLNSMRGSIMPTYVVKNHLRRHYKDVDTAWVLRRLKSMEKCGAVRRVDTNYVTMLCWAAALGNQEGSESNG